MLAKYEPVLPVRVVAAAFNDPFGDQLVIEEDIFGPPPPLLLKPEVLPLLKFAAALFGDQLVIEYDFCAAPTTPPPPERLDM
jgi:hypothetical protein